MRALFTFLFNSLSTAHASFKSRTYITPLENQPKQLHLEISNSLEQKHSIARCAKQLNISESYFQLIYKKLLLWHFLSAGSDSYACDTSEIQSVYQQSFSLPDC